MNESNIELNRCHDCGCLEGQLHQWGCDMETCPFCLRQLTSCDCYYSHFREKYYDDESMSADQFEQECDRLEKEGMTESEEAEWVAEVLTKGRIPYVIIPTMCRLCGRLWPHIFTVTDEEWEKHVIPPLQDKILCYDCYEQQKVMFPDGWKC